MKNILLIISGPSGVGKGTLCKKLLASDEDVVTSVSCTTRLPREGEIDGKDYFFLTKAEFEKRIAADDFLEYDEHFGNYYGTPKSFVTETLKEKSVILEIEVNGAANAKKRMPSAVSIFIAPPSEEELFSRLAGRQSENEAQIRDRIARAKYELSFADRYDYTIVNDDLDEAYMRLREIIEKEKNKI